MLTGNFHSIWYSLRNTSHFLNWTVSRIYQKVLIIFQFFSNLCLYRSASPGATGLSTSKQDENPISPGEFFFRIEIRKGADDETQCRKWVAFQEDNVKSLITAIDLPRCPCSERQAKSDSRFVAYTFDLLTRIRCFYSVFRPFIFVSEVGGFVSQKCCYLRDFGALVVDDVDAGSVELFNTSLPDGVLDDIAAKQVCCYGSPNCNKFYSVRPSQDCTGYRPFRRGKWRFYFSVQHDNCYQGYVAANWRRSNFWPSKTSTYTSHFVLDNSVQLPERYSEVNPYVKQ